jgi:hypothetical protein
MSVAARGGETLRFSRPTPGLQLAYDPRLPAGNQVFEFVVNGTAAGDRVVWAIDGQRVATESPAYRWPVTRGQHLAARGADRRARRGRVHGPVTLRGPPFAWRGPTRLARMTSF